MFWGIGHQLCKLESERRGLVWENSPHVWLAIVLTVPISRLHIFDYLKSGHKKPSSPATFPGGGAASEGKPNPL